MYNDTLPSQIKVLVLGGGIHGVGVLHDLVSRGWCDVHLLEKKRVGEGTSSKSTKLIHGGLRYLRYPRQYPLVYQCLKERKLLLKLVPDLVKPLEILFPILNSDPFGSLKVKLGLTLYDLLAGKDTINTHAKINKTLDNPKLRPLELQQIKNIFSYWDAQTNDLRLVKRIASCSKNLGAKITEQATVREIQKEKSRWAVQVRDNQGNNHTIHTQYIVNCLGPWANSLLKKSKLTPNTKGIQNKGSHIVLPDINLNCGYIIQKPIDQRILFILPWEKRTLVGTTEEFFSGDPSKLSITQKEIDYLLSAYNNFFVNKMKESDICASFSGLRWLAQSGENLTATSREHVLDEISHKNCKIITLFGGKLTSYRALSEKIGDRICKYFLYSKKSQTHLAKSWATRKKK